MIKTIKTTLALANFIYKFAKKIMKTKMWIEIWNTDEQFVVWLALTEWVVRVLVMVVDGLAVNARRSDEIS